MKSTVKTGYPADDEFIDVENVSDSEQIEKTPMGKFCERPENSKSNGSDKTIVKPSIKRGTLSQPKTVSFQENKTTTSRATYSNKKKELSHILFEIMNKMFSARVVLERIPNPIAKKIEPAKKPITKNKKRKTMPPSKTAFIHEGSAYMRVCPKCGKEPAVRKTQHCLSCKIELTYECTKCHKQCRNYKMVLAHLDSKCFIRGFHHCSVCDFKTVSPARVKAHMARLHPSVEYNKKNVKWTDAKKSSTHKCSQCGKEFGSHEFLNKHIPLCNKTQEMMEKAKSKGEILINKDFQKMIIRFCRKCDKDTKLYTSGVSSLKPCQKCGSAMKFKCSRCDKRCEEYSSAVYHTRLCGTIPIREKKRRIVKSETTIECRHCNKPFVQKFWLKRHLLRCKVLHRKSRHHKAYKHLKVSCKNCDEAQSMPERRKICGNCKSPLHHRCEICDKNFNADHGSWCEHLKCYLDAVKYECNDCGVGLTSKEMLWFHLSVCNKEKLHCDLCDYTTKFKSSIFKHILFVHPVLK